jgi:hypothetical protein
MIEIDKIGKSIPARLGMHSPEDASTLLEQDAKQRNVVLESL